MEIITSHIHLDLDGLASMILAKKLHPNAKLVFSGNVNKNVRTFANLYQDYLKILRGREIDIKDISKMILTDTANISRIGKFKKYFENENYNVVAYDHHIKDKENLKGENIILEEYGSATTVLLMELMKQKKLKLKDYEATLCMMGIYEDTGSLSYITTTPEDIDMAAYLLRNRADLEQVNKYITHPLQKRQTDVFLKLMENGEIFNFSVEDIFVGKYYTEEFIDGIDGVTNKIKEVEGVSGAFVLIGNNDKASIIGRSSSMGVRVDEIMEEFNGGGHVNAGSASLKNINFDDVYENLKMKVKKIIKIGKAAKDIMSSPVKSVFHDTSLKEAYKIMLRFGYNGLPILNKGKLIGIISRRDLDKAISHGFGESAVEIYMSSKVITAKLSTPVERLKQLLIENEIGRIPILNSQKKLVGIVTRSDILRTLYNQRKKSTQKYKMFHEDVKSKIKNRIPSKIYNILKIIEKTSKLRQEKAFLVGGIVRDLLLDIENDDIDIVIEGDGIEFAKKLGKRLDAKEVVTHEKFKTAVVVLKDNTKLDIATSRVEYYEYPTSLPKVEFGNIKQDLFRRDFTINAMAIEIDHSNFGELIDFFNGYEDLKSGKINVLHNLSFIEDPTRIIRAIRFSNRYGFEIDEDTEKFIYDCIKKGFLDELTWKRVKYEFRLIFSEKNVEQAIYKLFEYGVFSAINENISLTSKLKNDLKKLEENFQYIKKLDVKQWIIYFLILLEELKSSELKKVFEKFTFSKKFIDKYNYGRKKRGKIFKKLSKIKKDSEIYDILNNFSDEVLLLLLVTSRDYQVEKNIRRYIDIIRNINPIITGNDLIELGYDPGEYFKKLLKNLYYYQLDNNINNKKKLLKKINSIIN
ncbi:MAG: CBS domain-containing protein [Fusobacteriota bacterium]